MIRILELISIPNHSIDSFILIKFNPLSTWRDIVCVHSSEWCNSLDWIYLNDADVFLQVPILIPDSRAHYRSETLQRFIYLIKIQHFVLMEGDC